MEPLPSGHSLLPPSTRCHLPLPLPQRSVPSDADKQLLGLLASARERVHSALVGQGHWNAAVDGKPDSVGLVVYNSLLNSLVALG